MRMRNKAGCGRLGALAGGVKRVFGWATMSMALLGPGRLTAEPVANFDLIDQWGRAHELRRQTGPAVVLFFTANGCPVARQNASKLLDLWDRYHPKGVSFFLVNSSSGDDRASIRREAHELGIPMLPVLKDETQGLARHLKVYRTCEALVIRPSDWEVVYRGAVDDQFVEGAGKPQPSRHYLSEALEAVLSGADIAIGRTEPRGCRIHFDGIAGRSGEPVSYVREIVPILRDRCVDCHSPGNIGSWAMNSHRKVRGMAAMIEEVLLTRRMPPWDADPAIGRFSNHAALTPAEASTLLLWVEQGARMDADAAEDPLATMPLPQPDPWPLGEPDLILRLPQPQVIPATGVLDYRHIELRAGNEVEGWMRGIHVRPGNRRVVHHVIVQLKKGNQQDRFGGAEMLDGWAPGWTQGLFPEGTGKYLPKDAVFDVEFHYTTCGVEQTDDTEIGIYLCKEPPRSRFQAVPVANLTFAIPPHSADNEVHGMQFFDRPATLHSVTPHMHLRGKWMRFELYFPDGRRQTVCSVPRYDFNWQLTYVLEKPLRIPAGTWGMLVGGFDNSAGNPSNPDPDRWVHWGEQSWEEMFIGWYHVAWDPH